MITVTQFYVEKAKARIAEKEGKIPSDYRMAKLLGISQQHMSRLMARNSKYEIGDENAVKLAELAGVPAAEIISQIHLKKAEEADNPKLLRFWEQVSNLAKTGALAGFLGAALMGQQFVAPYDVENSKNAGVSMSYKNKTSSHFVLC